MAEPRKVDVDPVALEKVAEKFADLFKGESRFSRVEGLVVPNAGGFDTAQWVEDLVRDRVTAIAVHVRYMDLACEEIAEGLVAIADSFVGKDRDNAELMGKLDGEAKKTIKGMGDAEFEPVLAMAPKNYDSGDNGVTNDRYRVEDVDKDGKFEVSADFMGVYGIEEWRRFHVGPGDDKPVDLDWIPMGERVDVELEPPTGDNAPPRRPEGGGFTTGAGYDTENPPTQYTRTDTMTYVNKNNVGGEFIQYFQGEEPQKDEHGNPVWWWNGSPWPDTNGNGVPDVVDV